MGWRLQPSVKSWPYSNKENPVNPLLYYTIVLSLTLLTSVLLTGYLQPHLYRILLGLCKTKIRMGFWVAFTNILLIGLPLLIALNFQPKASRLEQSFFEILGRLGGNLVGYLVMLIGIGVVVTAIAIFAPQIRDGEK
jgi:hypothetical protein